MLLILSDVPQSAFKGVRFPAECKYVYAPEGAQGCCGCFKCWFEHPGSCVKNDAISDFSADMGRCDRLLIVSKNTYGSYSPSVKRILERSISFVRPSFTLRKGEMHHKRRYKTPMTLDCVLYGSSMPSDRAAARRLWRANALNMCATLGSLRFPETPRAEEVFF